MVPVKVDLRRELRGLYAAPREPVLVEVPELPYLMIDGSGDPKTTPAFQQAIEALFAVSYGVKFALRRADAVDFAVMPLEGLWSAGWTWTAMIVQPEELTAEVLAEVKEAAAAKRPLPARLRLELLEEGLAAQVLHVGPYSQEGPTIERLHAFIHASELEPSGPHHEIYLGDPRRAAPDKLRTILRQPARPAR